MECSSVHILLQYYSFCVFLFLTVRLTAAGEIELGYKAYWMVGLSIHGDVIVCERDSTQVRRYSYEAGSYKETATAALPQELHSGCRKEAGSSSSSRRAFLQDDSSSPTHILGESLQQQQQIQHEGELIGCLPPNNLVYAQEIGRGKWVLKVTGERSLTLAPPQGSWGWHGLSVCRTAHSIIVT